jgi:hypothetical protein
MGKPGWHGQDGRSHAVSQEHDLPEGAPAFGDYISMGGLFTIVKVRDRLTSYDEDPGWYQHPPGTVALRASDADLARDGVDMNEPSTGG